MPPPRSKPQPPWSDVPNIQVQTIESTELSIQWLEHPGSAGSDPPLHLDQKIQLNFRDLHRFEPVHNQYQRWGVRFEGAIALQPSNPAFAAADTPSVMPMSPRSLMTIHFQQPQQYIGGILTGAQPIKLWLYGPQEQLLVQQQIGCMSYVYPVAPQAFPKHQFHCSAANIVRVELSSDAPFLLHHFFWG
ncbi:MAG: hypothetical protein IGS50_15525 [Synechococcales cyanobacterium C42_A2020_086]|jgi:hypothetical protein|nr:hypothetical protein [Synechococcales cyanobacterium C42_A2020_086]